jgi:hypothetical protein
MTMPNLLIPAEERNLSPEEVDILDRRRRRGQAYLVIATLVTMWAGQDATYSPGWAHPMLYWDLLLFAISFTCLTRGVLLKRGSNEFFSY